MELGQKVRAVDIEKQKNDPHLTESSLRIIAKSDFVGEVTQLQDNLVYVSYKNDLGWVTQVFKPEEVK